MFVEFTQAYFEQGEVWFIKIDPLVVNIASEYVRYHNLDFVFGNITIWS